MKYYLIAGEASGDLHAAHLMKALSRKDPSAEFRCLGGDLMAEAGGKLVRHYRDMAYMGIVPVLLHLPTIFSNMRMAKRDIVEWQPDVVILIDYPGFNLDIAKFLHAHTRIPAFYYISPKIWAWKEWRIKAIRRDISQMFSILPFEVEFFEGKHHYPIHYVGNPTADEVRGFLATYQETEACFRQRHHLGQKPIIALLAGSRRQEIKDNLPAMIKAAEGFTDYELVVAGAPGIEPEHYGQFLGGSRARLLMGETYALLSHSAAALVTSGTATLETALFRVPQVVCYETPLPKLIALLRRLILKVPFISLVNLIADSEVVPELVADTFTVENIRTHLAAILPGGQQRAPMLQGYELVAQRLGTTSAPENAARIMIEILENKNS